MNVILIKGQALTYIGKFSISHFTSQTFCVDPKKGLPGMRGFLVSAALLVSLDAYAGCYIENNSGRAICLADGTKDHEFERYCQKKKKAPAVKAAKVVESCPDDFIGYCSGGFRKYFYRFVTKWKKQRLQNTIVGCIKSGDTWHQSDEYSASFDVPAFKKKMIRKIRQKKGEMKSRPQNEKGESGDGAVVTLSKDDGVVGDLIKNCSLRPAWENKDADKLLGFEISSMKPGSRCKTVGLEKGAIVKQVDETKLDEPEKGFEIFYVFENEGTHTLHIRTPKGEPRVLRFKITK